MPENWRNWAAVAFVLAALVLLYPRRELAPGKKPKGLVEITFMGPGGPIGGAMADAVREFERESEKAHERDSSRPVYRVISGQDAARDQVSDPTRFLVSVAGGTPPDVIFFDRFAVAEWAARGAFLPLDPFIERDLKAGRKDTPHAGLYYKSCWDETVYRGKVYCIPNGVDDRALFYNKNLLKRAGLVDVHGRARPPRDWDELLDYAVRLTERDREGRLTRIGFAPQYGNSWLYIYGWMAGGEFMSKDGTRCTLNDPKIVRALEYMTKIYDALGGYAAVNAFQAGFQGGELDPFIQGKVAMKIDGSWNMPHLAAYGQGLDFGVAPPPMPKSEMVKGRRVTWNGGWSYAIPAAARNRAAAWEFIRYITSDRAVMIMTESERADVEAQGRLFIPYQHPVIHLNRLVFEKYVYANPLVPRNIKDGCRVFNDLLPAARFRPVTPVGQLMWNEHVNATENALYHNSTAREALDRGTAVVQRDLDRLLKPRTGSRVRWSWFFLVYPALLALIALAVFEWDTKPALRQAVARLFRLPQTMTRGVTEGLHSAYFRRQWGGGFLCGSPWLLGFIIFGGGPMLFSLLISFCDYDILNPPLFTGATNYRILFREDSLVPTALWNTCYMAIGVPLGMAVSLALALLLNVEVRGIAAWRTMFYLPAIVPMVAASVLWIWIFNPEGGLINMVLRAVHVPGPSWLQDASWSKPSLILMGLWGSGGGMIIWLAGLKGIPRELYEAASIDGAGEFQQFRHVTIPQLTPYIFFNLVMGLIGTLQIFGTAFIMTGGGPVNSTLFYVYHLFNNAFRYGHMGYASAMAWILFALVLALTVVQLKLSKKWVHYEAG
jgi:multiple sugar transport system permease protein